MNAKTITNQNINNFNYMMGKSAGNKGTAILSLNSHYASIYFTNQDDVEKIKFLEKLSNIDLDTFYVSRISFEPNKFFTVQNDIPYVDYEASLVKYDIKELIENDFTNVRNIEISPRPTLVGYISISKYTKDLNSQKELISDLVALSSVEIHGEIEEYDCDATDDCQEFSYSRDSYSEGDYTLEHGESCTVSPKEECEYVDGRCSPHNNDVDDDFWSDDFDESGWLKEVDPNDAIAVYHRKGKDFYVGYTMQMEEIEIIWREEDFDYDVDDYDSDTFYYMSYTPNPELKEKVVQIIKSFKEDFEFQSYIYNELEIDSNEGGNWSYNDNVFDLHLLDLIFNDRSETRGYIMERIITKDKTLAQACKDVSDELILEHVTFNIDMSMEIEHIDYFSTKEPIKTKYNQLKVIKRLQNRLGYELVWSLVNTRGTTYGFAIKQGEEEYHFELSDLFNEEEDINPIEFVQDCLVAINKRIVDNMAEEELFEKASHVFVGVSDSYAVGNCEFGTREFLERNRKHIDTAKVGGIRGDFLLELENSNFTKNMVIFKIMQIANNQNHSVVSEAV